MRIATAFLPLLPLVQAVFPTVQYVWPQCGSGNYDIANGSQAQCANAVPCASGAQTDCNADIANPTSGVYAFVLSYPSVTECSGPGAATPTSQLVWKNGTCYQSTMYVCNGTHVVEYNCKALPLVEVSAFLYDRCVAPGVRAYCQEFIVTKSPTPRPSGAPNTPTDGTTQTRSPTQAPSDRTLAPSDKTLAPSDKTLAPSDRPTMQGATRSPTAMPTMETKAPSDRPTMQGATRSPTAMPTMETKPPTDKPTIQGATRSPTLATKAPTDRPTVQGETRSPSLATRAPTDKPTEKGTVLDASTAIIVGPSVIVLGWALM